MLCRPLHTLAITSVCVTGPTPEAKLAAEQPLPTAVETKAELPNSLQRHTALEKPQQVRRFSWLRSVGVQSHAGVLNYRSAKRWLQWWVWTLLLYGWHLHFRLTLCG